MITVKRKEASLANESLGIQLTLTGNQDEQKKVLKQKSESFAAQVSKKRCNKTAALWTFQHSFMPSLSYPMVVTQFSEDEWKKIISPAARATMNSAGMVKNMPHAIFYGPEKYQGLNVHNPYFLQGIIHVMVLIQESVLQSQTGTLLKACAEAFRVKIGIPFSLTNTKYDRRTFAYYVPNCWYKTLWKFTSLPEFDSCLEIVEDFEDPPLLRQRDVYLMSVFETNGYKREELKALNFVWKYLHAFTLADIATIDGKKISQQSMEGIDSNRLREDIKWPRIPPALPSKFLRLWKAALTKCFLTSYSTISNNRVLQYTYQLGPWTSQIH